MVSSAASNTAAESMEVPIWPQDEQVHRRPLSQAGRERSSATYFIQTKFPDKWFTGYILRGIELDFRIGFHGEETSLTSQMHNMVSTVEHPEIVVQYLEEEASQQRVIRVGTIARAKKLGIHCSPIGLIPPKTIE